ncbi:predicted protein [Plenodomus lingam JN3]|uniref:Predicted protein n=1 Tax=Leptosphaeria maculans (strain JN3 / isolate v23.1.3 / race Av1-4-5-6-7-8) TaxID=985895 RepID=E4ZTN3_LEPMJ|nr:predicted protein [Plenodomus lingam JN3]CBX94889.1 predicted protein [Plenodomus lingam JN3]
MGEWLMGVDVVGYLLCLGELERKEREKTASFKRLVPAGSGR